MVKPNAVLTIPLIVKSAAAVPSFAVVNVLVSPKATGQEIVAPVLVPEILFTVTFPPSVNNPEPEMVEPVVPFSKVTLVGVPSVNPPLANVTPALTVKALLTVAAPVSVFVPLVDVVKL